MGASQDCCSTTVVARDSVTIDFEGERQPQVASDLRQMNIFEFERRVKQFATPDNQGYIN